MKRMMMILALSAVLLCLAPCAQARSYRLGDADKEIEQIQTALDELDFYYADITGRFGTRTQAAVKKFQKRYHLPQTGIADEETLDLLYEKAGMDAPKSSAQIGESLSDTTLREGSEGDAVRMLQENLTLLKYYSGSITGRYGNLTKEAVRKFQRENDLSSDGVAGPRTLACLQKVLGGEEAQETPTAVQLPTKVVSLSGVQQLNTEWTLRRSSSSGYVRRLQQALSALGYDPGSADGKFGEKTELAVKAYQTARGLKCDGIAGRTTLRKINDDIRNGVTAEHAIVD